jgi:hypothetical protein
MIRQLPKPLQGYLHDQDAVEAIGEINANCRTVIAFINRFFRWFDAFRIVKYLNYASRSYYGQIPVVEAVVGFLTITGHKEFSATTSAYELLMEMREIERGNR